MSLISIDDPVYLEPLSEEHDIEPFRSRAAYLDWYLSHRALIDQRSGASRTFVAVNDPKPTKVMGAKRVEGFFTLEAGTMPTATILLEDGSPRFTERQASVIYLACLARDIRRKGQGYGDILLIEALRRAYLASEHIGLVGVFLYTLDEGESLYLRHGFLPFADDPKRLFLSLDTIQELFKR